MFSLRGRRNQGRERRSWEVRKNEGEWGEGRGNACHKNPIRFIPAQRFSVNPITLSVNNCHFIHQSKSGARFSAWLILRRNVPHADKTKTPLNFFVERLGRLLLINVISATPTKVCKRGKKAKEGNQNKNCRFCGTNFEAAAGEGECHFKT